MSNPRSTEVGRPIPWTGLVFTLLGSLVLLFIIAPLAGILLSSSFGEITDAAADEEVRSSGSLTLSAALMATIACTVTGIPRPAAQASTERSLCG